MSTTTARVLYRLDQVLKSNVPPGTGVFSDRADAVTRQECPCHNVLVRDATIDPFSGEMDKHELVAELRINVRNSLPTQEAEAQHEAVHSAIVTDSELLDLCVSVRQIGAAYERDEADLTSLIKTVQYRFTYLIPQATL